MLSKLGDVLFAWLTVHELGKNKQTNSESMYPCLLKELIQYCNTDVIVIAEPLRDHTRRWEEV